ncbi:hypothetical protein VPH35_034745 [Triticum aestivum]
MATAGAPPLHCGIPEEVAIWEILVRLAPKALLRCRAVCRAWRRATSTRDFLLAHHAHQPSLALIYGEDGNSVLIMPFNHRAGPVARLYSVDDALFQASCDGLLVICVHGKHFSIRNPATRQYANLSLLHGFKLLGMYQHSHTGEYRLLLYLSVAVKWMYSALPQVQEGSYVFTIGSGQPPRHIGCSDAEELICIPGSVCFHGGLHWYTNHVIKIFDTTAESFRQMRSPFVRGHARLFEVDSMLGMSTFNGDVDIWVVQEQDYKDEVWALKYRVELPVAEIRVQFGMFEIKYCRARAESCEGDVLVLLEFDDWLLQVDINGSVLLFDD